MPEYDATINPHIFHKEVSDEVLPSLSVDVQTRMVCKLDHSEKALSSLTSIVFITERAANPFCRNGNKQHNLPQINF